ncbi:hypothetical protein DY000_02022386 [Brassica cretica]|uniref:Uncharacterized protein n=1 Tax=Brassica cretica TaxID=69181 RepID=A0ABQ7E119_BRACR|nr:hypothetical protein DY000_02022386 [Brassica cretica]
MGVDDVLRRLQPQLAFRTASVPFASDDQAARDPTTNSSRLRSAARNLSLNTIRDSIGSSQLASRSCPTRGSFSWWSGFNNQLS